MRKQLFALTMVFGLSFGVVLAADPIKLELKNFKCKTVAEGDLAGFNENDGKLYFYTNGTASVEVNVPAEGTYKLTIEMSCDEAKGTKAQVKIKM
ncbi:MAG: hypothetical protein ACRCZF_26280, partial [Gemmataceae bacterium]